MNWWCSAQGQPWTWTWQPYIGVWLLIVFFCAAYWVVLKRWKPENARNPGAMFPVRFGAGVVAFWLAADWPLGALGAGYLLSVHTLQYILFVFAVPPLFISGMPRWMLRRLLRGRIRTAIAQAFTRPLPAFAVFNLVMLGTHLPTVVDGLTRSQLGSFAVDMTWLASGFAFWWPLLGPLPELRPMPYPGRLLYLVANIFIPTVPASFMTFADYPIYALYELAPPVSRLTAREDQQIAGLLMKVLGGLIILAIGTVLFFKWWSAEPGEDDLEQRRPMDGPDDGGNDDSGGDPTFAPPDGRHTATVS